MGEITRFAGMVFDRETKDIILIGRVHKDLPPVNIDDLVVALRSRFIAKDYPRVSIDRVEHTEKTGMQEVRFDGGIEGTEFGRDFLKSDVMLKRYSLDLLNQITGMTTYLKLYEAATSERLLQQNQTIEQIEWFSEEESKRVIEQNRGNLVSESSMAQSRFWFHVRADQSFIVERDDVYVIEELSLGVKAETLLNKVRNAAGNKLEGKTDEVGEEFALRFTDGFKGASEAHPVLQRLKVLFDLVAIAEGIAHLESDRPVLNHLIEEYLVKEEETPATYQLVQRVGEFRSPDGVAAVVQLSGGIELEAILLALEDGDLSALKTAVLSSRPSQEALSWVVPLDTWDMPNDYLPEAGIDKIKDRTKRSQLKKLGFGISAQRFIFDGSKVNEQFPRFEGFPLPSSMPKWQRDVHELKINKKTGEVILSPKIEKAMLAEEWAKVTELIGEVAPETSAVLRFLKAHACLAINRNNESVELFSVVTAEDINEWLKWCNNIANTTNNQALINYFLGDIYARLLNYEKAIEYLSLAINQNKNSYLALNARGTVYIIQEEYEKALSDLFSAKRIKPDFADVYNNLAMINIRQRKGLIDNSKNSFLAVLKVNPDFALAYHGLGCLELLESKGMVFPEDINNIQKALDLLPTGHDILIDNEASFVDAFLEKQSELRFTYANKEGTALKREYKLHALADRADKVYSLQMQLPSTTSNFHRSMVQKRGLSTQRAVAMEYSSMSVSERRDFAQRDPVGAGKTLNALTQLSHTYKRSLDDYSKGTRELTGVFDAGSKFPPFKPLLSGFKKATEHLTNAGYIPMQKRYDTANQLRENSIRDIDYTINKKIKAGTYNPASIPDQTVRHKQFNSGTYKAPEISIPSGNLSKGIPGQRPSFQPQGVTTDKALITWNDGEWPFDPIFGLLYQIPQTVSDENQINTEEEK
ncbi:tetratricopeptide repeat protein [bacterium]|nr:tetratricopeptide repeat protein [bacterium]